VTIKLVSALVLFLVVAGFKTLPLIFRLGTHISSAGDPLSITWSLAWATHALATDPSHLFDANTFYPLRRSLAFGEHALGALPIFAPVYLLTGNPLTASNVFLLLAFALSGFSLFCLAYYWTRAFWPSVAAGVFFSFAPYRFGEIVRPTTLNFFCGPLALVFLDRFLRTRRYRDLAGFTLFYLLQILSSVYLGYMITVVVVLYVGYFVLVIDRTLIRLSMLRPTLAFLGASLTVLLPLHLPYLDAHSGWGLFRSIGYVQYKSPDVLSYVLASRSMNNVYVALFQPSQIKDHHDRALFPGLVLPLLVLVGSCGAVVTLSSVKTRQLRQVFGLIAAAGVLLSLGPYLIAFGHETRIPLPYFVLYYVVPGWSAMQNPHRFTTVALLAASMLAAVGITRSCGPVSRWLGARPRLAQPLVSVAFIGLFLIELGWKPLPLVAVPTGQYTPDVYRWLAAERPGPLVELPFAGRSESTFLENWYIYFSTVHWLPIVNGSTSFVPPAYSKVKRALASMPAPEAVEYAGALGIKAIVLHTDRLSPETLSRWSAEETERVGLRTLVRFGPDIVYAVPTVPTARSIKASVALPDWLPRGDTVRLALVLHDDNTQPWAHVRPFSPSTVLLRWTDTQTGRSTTTNNRLALPLVVRTGETTTAAPLTLRVPGVPGTYTLQVSIPSLDIATEPRTVDIRGTTIATNRDATQLLSVRYLVDEGAAPRVVTTDDAITLDVTASNTGSAVWLSRAERNSDRVRLEWQWLKDGQALPLRGGAPLLFDVFPGQRHRFELTIPHPEERGVHVLEVALVGKSVHSFSTPPLKLLVNVRTPSERRRNAERFQHSAGG
jgi:hypothetical protein